MGPTLTTQPPVAVLDAPDAELLRRYLAGRDEPALDALVRRHGGMVLGVCRRVLGNPYDAEDAFQATFLVFVRKAGSVRPGALVGPWLHGIATRTALKARALVARRRAREKQVDSLPDVAAPAKTAAADWLPLLDREVAALPAKYRLPVLLCDLHGKSRTDAAGELGIPEGTLSSRLARARTLLRRRLSKRGAGAAVLVAAVLFPTSSPAASPILIQTTVRAATAFAAGTALTSPPGLIATAVLASFWRMRLTLAAGGLLMFLAVIGGVGLMLERSGALAAVVPVVRTDRELLQGDWVVAAMTMDGRDASQEEIEAFNKQKPLWVRGDEFNLPFDSDYVLDTNAHPKRIDLTCRIMPPPNNFQIGIYEVTDDELKLCLGPICRDDRPKAFVTEPGSGRTLMILKRRLPAK
jgi:RNA polymerase sigma factor (sigma-70 family)